MNIQDRVAELVLPMFDLVMNVLTLGGWSRYQGERLANFKLTKGGDVR